MGGRPSASCATSVLAAVIDDERQAVAGFITVGPNAGDADADVGEVYALNVDPAAWGKGYGRVLLQAGIDALRDAGFTTAILWVHPANERARGFYERHGWRADGAERRQAVLGVEVPEVRYEVVLETPSG